MHGPALPEAVLARFHFVETIVFAQDRTHASITASAQTYSMPHFETEFRVGEANVPETGLPMKRGTGRALRFLKCSAS
jgi:hypothetical protein